MERFAIVAQLKPDSHATVMKLIAEGPPFDPEEAGLEAHSVYLAPDSVVFVFEGQEAGSVVAEIVDARFRAPVFETWAAFLDGPPHVARLAYDWQREPPRPSSPSR
jgi:hypothetical protein